MLQLDGRAALATGSGIGAAVATASVGSGAPVMVFDVDGLAAKAVAERIRESGGMAEHCELDVRDSGGVVAGLSACSATDVAVVGGVGTATLLRWIN